MHWLLFIHKYYSPLHVSSLKCSSSGGYSCAHAAYGTVTLYESSWWPVGTQLEWELTIEERLLVGVLRHPPLYVFRATFCAHHQEFSTVHSALVSFIQVFDDRLQAYSGWNCSSHLKLQFQPDSAWKLSSKTCMKLISAEWILMMGREGARNM